MFQRAFRQIQAAWMAQDMASVEHFVSDGVCEMFSVPFREQQRLGYRNRMDNIRIRWVRFAHFASSGTFDVLTVEVAASAVDQRITLSGGRVDQREFGTAAGLWNSGHWFVGAGRRPKTLVAAYWAASVPVVATTSN